VNPGGWRPPGFDVSKDVQLFQTMQRKRKMGYSVRRSATRQLIFSPSLQLEGKWMTTAGFMIGQQVQVIVENGKIIIQP
jgi:hypothetical protein